MPRNTRPLRIEALQELIENSGLDFNDRNRKSWVFDCPKCGKEEKLYIRRKDGRFVCWYCRDKTPDGFEGSPEYALTLLLGRSVPDLQTVLYGPEFAHQSRIELDFSGYSLMPEPEPEYEGDSDDDYFDVPEARKLPTAILYPPNYYPIGDFRAKRGLAYLEGRGIPLDIAKAYDLCYDAPRRRVVFPVVTRGVMVGWQARATGSTEWVDENGEARKSPKILTTMVEGMRDNVLMFEHRLQGSEHAILSEGPVDALKCHLCGGNVCSMGKSVASGQVERLKAFGIKRLYLGQDPDAAEETDLLVKRYHEDFEMWYMTPEGTGYEDFGAMPFEVALECFRRAERVGPKRIFVYFDPDASPRL